MRNVFLPLFFFIPVLLLAQPTTYTPAQIERVAKLSELYGHVKFFHPYLGYKPINWDSAFAATAPLVAQANTDEEVVAALRQLLASLNDDATTVELTAKPAAAPPPVAVDSMRMYLTPDSTLVFRTANYTGASNYDLLEEKLRAFTGQLPNARAVLLDLRCGRVLSDFETEAVRYTFDAVRPELLLSAGPITRPGIRRRSHNGFQPEFGTSSGGYESAFYTANVRQGRPHPGGKNRPLVILVNRNSVLTTSLLALQSHPHVRVYRTEPLSEAQLPGVTVPFPFSETIRVTFRTGEVITPEGGLGVADVRLLPIPSEAPDEAHLLDLLRQPSSAPRGTPASANPAPLPLSPALPPPLAAPYPTPGNRLLAGAKIWSVIHYFHAYKDLMPTDWNAALRTALGALAAAPDSLQYVLAVARFYRNLQDGHGFINSTAYWKYVGYGFVPVQVRFIENQPVVTRVYAEHVAAKGVRVGDVVTKLNDEPVAARIARLSAITPASNEWTRRQYIAQRLLSTPGAGAALRLTLRGSDGREKTVTLSSGPYSPPPADTSAPFRRLPGNIGYVDLSRLRIDDVDRMFAALLTTKALLFDMRGYPHETAWEIAPRLTDRRNVVAARFFRYAPTEPDFPNGESNGSTQKFFFDQQLPPNPGKSVYGGKTVMLIDERTQSQAEHTGLFFEAANGTEFIGSPTAGANGDVTNFGVPGGITLTFSGHDVRHADGRQLQQVGLQPKILVRPTIQGIRAGEDEVLERAVRYLTTAK